MIDIQSIHPLTGFLRDHKSHIERLRASGLPEVLTINGKAQIVIQDAVAYQKMLDLIDELDATRILKQRLASLDEGKPGGPGVGVPADQVLKDVRRKLGIKGK